MITPILRWVSFAIDVHRGYVSYTLNNYTWNSLDGLACGALLVIALREFKWDRELLRRFSFLTIFSGAGVWLVGIPFGILSRQATPVGAALQVTPWNLAFTGLLGLCLIVGTSSWRGLVLSPFLRFFGRISYGLYLIHLLMFDAYDRMIASFFANIEPTFGVLPALCLRFLFVLGISVALAHLSREFFEEPFLRWKDRLASNVIREVSAPAAEANSI